MYVATYAVLQLYCKLLLTTCTVIYNYYFFIAYMNVYVCTSMYVCMYVQYVCMYVLLLLHTYTYTAVHTYTFIYIHT